MMALLTLTLGFKTRELRTLSLPIEIRRPNSALIARTVASKPIQLRPGRYYATASLPAGQQLLHAFEMFDENLTIELVPDPEEESSNEWHEAAHYLQPRKPSQREQAGWATARESFSTGGRTVSDAPAPAHVSQVKARFRLFEGDPINGTLEPRPRGPDIAVEHSQRGRVVMFRVARRGGPLIAQVMEPGGTVHNMAVPSLPLGQPLIVLTRRPDATCAIDVHLEHPTADMLLQYGVSNSTTAAEDAGRALLPRAEEALAGKFEDPVAAAVAAMAILRFGELKWLHDWTANLDALFDWMPDGAAIHGEHLARLGRHAQAAERFFEVPRRGLPFFGDAFFYTVERLKWYAELKPEHAGGIDQERVRNALGKLWPFANFVHRQRPITSYPGLDPRVPNNAPGPVATPNDDAIELAEWLGEPAAP